MINITAFCFGMLTGTLSALLGTIIILKIMFKDDDKKFKK